MAQDMTSDVWWVEAEGRRYGPFERAQMLEFVAEGRIVAATRVCAMDDIWRDAGDVVWLANAMIAEPMPATPIKNRVTAGPEAALLVWAKLSAFVGPRFMAAMAQLGPAVEVEPGLWLVRSTRPLAEARAKLSTTLTTEDRFLVAQVGEGKIGWRNLGPTTEARVRDLLRTVAALAPAND